MSLWSSIACLAIASTACGGGGGTPTRDAGHGSLDSGPTAVDAGPTAVDTGPTAMDAGPTEGDSGPKEDSGTGDTDAGPTCSDTICGDDCVDLSTDRRHCGACNNACGTSDTCNGGTCEPASCPTGMTACDGACVDASSDPANCGGCGTACATGEVCSAGACTISCAAPTTACGGACVDTSSDIANCGACGTLCAAGQTCAAGTCTCPGSTVECSGACVDTSSDLDNCGACGTSCGPGQACVSGSCTCSGGRTLCGSACVDTSADPTHCGACGTTCAASQSCVSGSCVCPGGRTLCGGTCVDTSADPSNCGTCGQVCGAGTSCSSGTCRVTPPVNDDFANATAITLGASEITIRSSTTNATHDGPTTTCGSTGDPNVWYRFTLARGAIVYFDTAGSSYDTKLYITDSTGTLLTGGAFCNDDSGCDSTGGFTDSLQSRVYGYLGAGTYYVGVGGYAWSSRGNFTLHGQMIRTDVGSYFYSNQLTGSGAAPSTVLVGTSASRGSCISASSGEDVRWFVTCGAQQSFSLCSAEGGTWTRQIGSNTYDPSMYIRSGQTGAEVACNDDVTSCPGTGGDTASFGSRLTNVAVPRGIAVHFVDERLRASGLRYTLAYTVR